MGSNNTYNIYLGHHLTGKDRSEFTYITCIENVPALNIGCYCDFICEIRKRIPISNDLKAHGKFYMIFSEKCSHV
jgi:hypothetical protein